ncbi:MAG: Ger(x)C family spore germination protein, partial [Cohnella sp.]|nr:Ger(x)C family spore germination protein [Cohnella sp.]
MKAAKSLIALALLMCCSLLSGCWNRREMNDIAIVLATGIDWVGTKYRVTVQVVDPSQMIRPSPGNRSAGLIYSEEGQTVYEALRRITNKSPRQLYYGHLGMLFLNEAAARKGFRKPADLLFRMPETRPDFKVVVTHNVSARDILSVVPPFEISPALDFFKALQNSEKEWAPTTSATIFDLMRQLSTDGWEPSLTAITIIGNRTGAMSQNNVKQPRSLGEYKYMGLAVFEDDKLVGLLNESDSKSFSYIRNKLKSTVARLPCPN